MKRLIINSRVGEITEQIASNCAKVAKDFEEKKGKRDRVTVTVWGSSENNTMAYMAHGKNIHDSGGIWM